MNGKETKYKEEMNGMERKGMRRQVHVVKGVKESERAWDRLNTIQMSINKEINVNGVSW